MNFHFEPDIDFVDEVEEQKEDKPASGYQVRLLNSDYAEFGCIMKSLLEVFHLTESCATQAAMEAHQSGSVVLGCWTKDIAETRVSIAQNALVQRHLDLKLDEPSNVYLCEPMD